MINSGSEIFGESECTDLMWDSTYSLPVKGTQCLGRAEKDRYSGTSVTSNLCGVSAVS